MKILYCHQHFSTRAGAAGTRSYETATRLVARGHQVTVLCGSYAVGRSGLDGPFRRGRRTGTVDGIRVVELELPYANRDGYLRRSWAFLRFAVYGVGAALRYDYDLLFASSTPLTAGIPGIAARYLRGKPFVFEVRDLWPELPRALGVVRNPLLLGLLSGLEWLCYRAARACVGLSPGIVAGICRRGVDPQRVAMIPNGCDLTLFGAATAQPLAEAGQRVAVFCGTHGLANGLDAVLDAAQVLRTRGREDIRLVLIGTGQQKPALQARAAAQGLHNCRFLDPLPKTELAGLLCGADIGLQVLANVPAFYYGTSPNKFFDYLAAGLPVLINYPGWLAELIGQAGCGLAVAPQRPGAFADALEYLADHPSERKLMGQKARRLAETRFDRDRLAAELVNLLETAY